MFTRKSLPLGVLVMLLVLALASLGVGYGLWSKVLTIDGTVNTGEVNAEFISAFTDDDGVVNDPMSPPRDDGDDGTDPAGKPVADCIAGIVDPDEDPQDGSQAATVTIGNAYPSYECTAWFGVKNNGTIPVMVQAILQHGNFDHWYSCDSGTTWTFAAASTWYDYCGTSVIKHIAVEDPDTGELVPVLNVHVTKLLIGDQIDPGDHTGIDVHIHVKQGAPQNATYKVDERIELVQWNEYES